MAWTCQKPSQKKRQTCRFHGLRQAMTPNNNGMHEAVNARGAAEACVTLLLTALPLSWQGDRNPRNPVTNLKEA